MSLALKIENAREQRRKNPSAVRLVRSNGEPVSEPYSPQSGEDDTVIILRDEWRVPVEFPVANDPVPVAPVHKEHSGSWARIKAMCSRAFAVSIILIAFVSTGISAYTLGTYDRELMDTRTKIAAIAAQGLDAPIIPKEWDRVTGKPK